MSDELRERVWARFQEQESLISHDDLCIYIDCPDLAHPYQILRNECDSYEKLAVWTQHLLGKTWMTNDRVRIFQAKAAELFHPDTRIVL